MAEFNIALIPGDGIGPEIVSGAVTVLDAVSKKYGHKFNYQEVYMGGCAIDKYGVPLPQETVDICKKSDSVLLGAVGGPKWDSQPSENRPEKGLLGIRKALELYSNLRPSILKPQLKDASPLKDEKLEKGLNVMVVRELTGGIYFGERKKAEDGSWASDTEKYSVEEIKRIGKIAFETAMLRDKRVVSVDKANVLESSRLWRKTMIELSADYPEVELTHMYVDNAAMQLAINPAQFDVSLHQIYSEIFFQTFQVLLQVQSVCCRLRHLAQQSAVCTNRFTAVLRILQVWILQTLLQPLFQPL